MRCDICGNENLRSVLDLGNSPPTCHMPKIGEEVLEEAFTLELVYCEECGLTQLSEAPDPNVVFPPDYPYSSGNSGELRKHFAGLAEMVGARLGPDDLVVDIGANDGTLLSNFGSRTVGVEPTGQAKNIDGPAYQEFFTEELAKRIREHHGPAKVVTACNVLAHVDDIHDVMRGIKRLLSDDGVLVAENHALDSVLNGQWDTVYHEHLRYYDSQSFALLLALHGLESQGWDAVSTHGGSFRTIASVHPRPDFKKLEKEASASREDIIQATNDGAWGIGATARATTLINFCGLDIDDIQCVCEVAGSDKIGRVIPGTRIPVIDEAELFDKQPAKAILFSWHLADFIVPKLRERGYEGEIIVPLPEVRSL